MPSIGPFRRTWLLARTDWLLPTTWLSILCQETIFRVLFATNRFTFSSVWRGLCNSLQPLAKSFKIISSSNLQLGKTTSGHPQRLTQPVLHFHCIVLSFLFLFRLLPNPALLSIFNILFRLLLPLAASIQFPPFAYTPPFPICTNFPPNSRPISTQPFPAKIAINSLLSSMHLVTDRFQSEC